MCGINLFIDKRNSSDETVIVKMNAATKHRGPDAGRWGKYTSSPGTVYIGNNRLKIIDTSDEANQPFHSADGRYVLSFNGEIYNYKTLRSALAHKYSFQTGSDTEVLLYHLIEYGVKGIDKLNGMFAFILYDLQAQTIQVVRDRHGVKPVYYFSDETTILISSEIKGLLASGRIIKKFNSEQISHYLNYKYAKRPETFYANIFELEPGGIIEIKGDSFQIKKWREEEIGYKKEYHPSSLLSDVKALLSKAVGQQLQSDVANGIFLSGGVDSTLLLALTRELGIKNLPSFSVVNSAADSAFGTDDYRYAKKAADLYNSEHHEISIDSQILKDTELLLQQLDQPIGDSALLLTWLISDKASSSIRVALSGAGADEWFAGYNRHWAYRNYLNYFYGNNLLIRLGNSSAGLFPDGFSHPLRRPARLWNKFAQGISSDPSETYDHFRSLNYPENINTVFTKTEKSIVGKEELLYRALLKDRKEYLVSDVLTLTDKMSMLKSLEVRVPYLDNDLTTYLSALPPGLLLKEGRKWILKELLKNMGGKDFVSRNKEGFGMPVGKWIKEEKNSYLLEHIRNKNSYVYNYIAYETVNSMLSSHLSGRKDHSSILWSLIVLTNWMQKEF